MPQKPNQHPIIRDYLLTNKNLDEIVKKKYNKNYFLEKVFNELVIEIHKKKVNPNLLQEIDEAIIKGHQDSSLYILFLTISMLYNHYFLQIEKASSICSIIESFSKNKIPPVIISFFLQGKATLLRSKGNTENFVNLMKKSIENLDKKSPRHLDILFNYYGMYALQGKLFENNRYDIIDKSENWPQYIETRFWLLKIVNSLYNGNIEEGHQNNKLLANSGIELGSYDFYYYDNLLKILSGEFDKTKYTNEDFIKLATIFDNLSKGKIEEAQNLYNSITKIGNKQLQIFKYLPLHLELCQRKSGMAKFLLKEKESKGDIHYLDDLFLGRIQLLENDLEGADKSFSRLTQNINRFCAKGRLEFELIFAKEMQLPHILKLLKGWESNKKTLKNNIKKTYKDIKPRKGVDLLIGKSAVILKTKESISKFATLKAPILITGETGTGKELVARAIHDEGPNSNEPFLAINCGALTDTLLQSELFGYVAGAFTGAQNERVGIFEAAGKGTVFLDEFGDISSKLQVSLLRVLEANEIRLIGGSKTSQIQCKIVIATNIDLQNAVAEKKFREDLYFRLTRFEIRLPALKERPEDIPELIQFFLNSNSDGSKNNIKISEELMQILNKYPWPGNVRELKNEMERLVILNPNLNTFGVENFDMSHLSILQQTESNIINRPLNSDNNNGILKENEAARIIENGFRVENRHNKIKNLFRKYKKLTRSQIIQFTKVGLSTATKDLKTLTESNFIIRRSPTKSSSTDYFELIED